MIKKFTKGNSHHQIQPPIPTLDSLPKKIYVDGKMVESKKSHPRERSNLIHNFTVQLSAALDVRKKDHRELLQNKKIPSDFLDVIELVIGQTSSVIDQLIEHEDVGAPPALSNARNLLNDLLNFETTVEKRHDFSWECLEWIIELRADIRHYVNQIEMSYAIVNQDESGRVTPIGRPTTLLGKQAYWDLVQEHQAVHGLNTFPKSKHALSRISALGISVTPRTLTNWRLQIKNGTFDDYLQTKNRK